MRFLFAAAFTLLSCTTISAQVDVGLGAELGFPFLFNQEVRNHNHASGAPGVRGIITYAPENGFLTGSLIAGYNQTILPMVRFNGGLDVLYMRFRNTNVTLLGRFKKEMGGDAQLLYGVGVGAQFLTGTGVQVSKRSDNDISRIIADSTNYNKITLPTFNLNVEYIRPASQGSKFYYGIGVQLQYVYLLDQTETYRVDIIDKNLQYYSLRPQLTGNIINPVVFANLYYRL